MTTYLLDASALIALAAERHVFHDRVAVWRAPDVSVAICPVVEGALVRFLVREGEHPGTIAEVLRRLRSIDNCAFWPDDVSYADVDLGHVIGHRQVTDTYLAALAVRHGGLLATLDTALHRTLPDATFLIPE